MATTAPKPATSATQSISYTDLYARWERGNWRATEIDLTQDAIDWREKLTDAQRRSALWLYTLFFHGEDSVTDNLSPYIDAAPLEEQKYFLTTQQVDEARHSIFFNRFMHEVVGLGDGTLGSGLRATEPQITWGHRKVFTRLDEMAAELRADRSTTKLAEAVTLYHVVVEASLAQPGQHMIEGYLEQFDVLPGFRAGMRSVALDEQRHIGFGVKLLADLYAQDPDRIGEAIVGVLREVLPWTAAVAAPPGWDETYTTAWGFTLDDLGEAGAASMEQKLRAIGLPVDDLPRFPLPMDLPPRERAARGQRMLRANLIGAGEEPVVKDPEAVAILFDQMRRQADATAVPSGTTIEWAFTDFEPWHLTLREGDSVASAGHAAHADLVLRTSLQSWADLTAGRADPLRLVLTRRLRPKGDLRLLPRLGRVFG
jgi:ribonucleotide reductase beta subunit family protein with ferritin-like domain